MSEILQKFSRSLKARRKALGMTQRDLADKISYSEKAVSKWESGVALPPSALLPTLSAILGVSIDELLMGKNEIRYYLGIDGGASKTEFLLVNSEGNVTGVGAGYANIICRASNGVEASCTVTVKEDSIVVYPSDFHTPKEPLCGHNDHRIVMSMAVLATLTGGTIEGAEAVAKSFPDFFEKLKSLGIVLSQSED